MKRAWAVMLLSLFLTGCLHSKESLVINTDGTGTLKTELIVPKGTVSLVDQMMGGFMQQMAQAIPQGEEPIELPPSIAEEMFGNKETIIKKAQAADLNIKFTDFTTEKKDGALHVKYALQFDDILKLGLSGVPMTQFKIDRTDEGDWKLSLHEDEKMTKDTQSQIEQFKQPDLSGLSPEERVVFDEMQEALKDLRIEFKVSMPLQIKEANGMFKQMDPNTAGIEVYGNLLDPEFYQQMSRTSPNSSVIWTGAGEAPIGDIGQGSGDILTDAGDGEDIAVVPDTGSGAEGEADIYLMNGQKVSGKIIENTDDYVKVEVTGVELKYYKDEIDRIENNIAGGLNDEVPDVPSVDF
jgi:sRNA-binding regulator protein Hfq